MEGNLCALTKSIQVYTVPVVLERDDNQEQSCNKVKMSINGNLKLLSHETLTHCENLSAITLYGFQIQYRLSINEIPDYI